MEYEARQFARKVLFVHLAALLVVLAVVVAAARVLYINARTQAIEQAKHTQELLAKQTALGIKNYYESVSGVLNLLQPPDGAPATQQQSNEDRQRGPRQLAARRDRLALAEGSL